jgi:tryptophan synthase alpha chain
MSETLLPTASRLEAKFIALRARKKKALVAYLCVGDPNLDEAVDLAIACVEAGADILELGVPFSDPTADGPSIALASQRAIKAGGSFKATLDVARKIRVRSEVPIVVFGYYNPIFVHGEIASVRDAAEAGIDAFLVVDLPFEEGATFRAAAYAAHIAIVPLLAPTSTAERARALKGRGASAGFVYYVSVAGVTGAAAAPLAEASRSAAKLREGTGLPVVVGFGIATPDDARVASAHADGVVVGTAIVRAIEAGTSAEDRIERVRSLISSLRAALDTPA